jgi:hypothetical protein
MDEQDRKETERDDEEPKQDKKAEQKSGDRPGKKKGKPRAWVQYHKQIAKPTAPGGTPVRKMRKDPEDEGDSEDWPWFVIHPKPPWFTSADKLKWPTLDDLDIDISLGKEKDKLTKRKKRRGLDIGDIDKSGFGGLL